VLVYVFPMAVRWGAMVVGAVGDECGLIPEALAETLREPTRDIIMCLPDSTLYWTCGSKFCWWILLRVLGLSVSGSVNARSRFSHHAVPVEMLPEGISSEGRERLFCQNPRLFGQLQRI
jgi:hypothetical protein